MSVYECVFERVRLSSIIHSPVLGPKCVQYSKVLHTHHHFCLRCRHALFIGFVYFSLLEQITSRSTQLCPRTWLYDVLCHAISDCSASVQIRRVWAELFPAHHRNSKLHFNQDSSGFASIFVCVCARALFRVHRCEPLGGDDLVSVPCRPSSGLRSCASSPSFDASLAHKEPEQHPHGLTEPSISPFVERF